MFGRQPHPAQLRAARAGCAPSARRPGHAMLAAAHRGRPPGTAARRPRRGPPRCRSQPPALPPRRTSCLARWTVRTISEAKPSFSTRPRVRAGSLPSSMGRTRTPVWATGASSRKDSAGPRPPSALAPPWHASASAPSPTATKSPHDHRPPDKPRVHLFHCNAKLPAIGPSDPLCAGGRIGYNHTASRYGWSLSTVRPRSSGG